MKRQIDKQRRRRHRAFVVPRMRTAVPVPEPDSGEPEQPFAEGAHDTLSPDLRHRLVSETAYHHLAERGFADGYETDDWQQAASEVDHVLIKPDTSEAP